MVGDACLLCGDIYGAQSVVGGEGVEGAEMDFRRAVMEPLKEMLDFSLLKRLSFSLLVFATVLTMMGKFDSPTPAPLFLPPGPVLFFPLSPFIPTTLILPHIFVAPENDVKTPLSFEVIQTTQNENTVHFNQSCSGKLIVNFLHSDFLFKSLPVENEINFAKLCSRESKNEAIKFLQDYSMLFKTRNCPNCDSEMVHYITE